MHLDELPEEVPGAGIGLRLEPVDVGDGGADEVVHELELAPDRGCRARSIWARSTLSAAVK